MVSPWHGSFGFLMTLLQIIYFQSCLQQLNLPFCSMILINFALKFYLKIELVYKISWVAKMIKHMTVPGP